MKNHQIMHMNISRTKFIILFIISGFAFLFITTSLLGSTGPRGFPQPPDSLMRTGAESSVAWKNTASTILFPIKMVLIGPVSPLIEYMRQDDPPPPFIGIILAFYWSILALILHYLLGKIKRS